MPRQLLFTTKLKKPHEKASKVEKNICVLQYTKAETHGTCDFVRFGEMPALKRFGSF